MRQIPRLAGAVAAMALLLTISAAHAAHAAADDEAVKGRFDYARRLFLSGSLERSEEAFKSLLNEYPKSEYAEDARYWLGKYYMLTGSFDEGLEQFRTIVSADPPGAKAALAQFEIAGYWFNPVNPKSDYAHALAEYIKIPYFYPQSPLVDDAFYYSALCQFKLRRFTLAADELGSFIEKFPGSEFAAPARYTLGLVHLILGRDGEAAADFQAVRDDYPAGLYRDKALDAIELLNTARRGRVLSQEFTYRPGDDGPDGLEEPVHAALGEDGLLYVTAKGGEILRFIVGEGYLKPVPAAMVNPAGKSIGRAVRPGGIAVGPRGRLYVADTARHMVRVYEPDGSEAFSFGTKGSEAGELDSPSGIAVDEGGSIYVADTGNSRIDKFDYKGRFITAFGDYGQITENLLVSPSGMAVDMQGNILATDKKTARIYNYDTSGRLLYVYSGRAGGAFSLEKPGAVGTDGIGNVYVLDDGDGSILVFDRDLAPLAKYPPAGARSAYNKPAGLAVSGAGRVFVTDIAKDRIVVLR